MPSRLLKKITRYRDMVIATYDPTGSDEVAGADWRAHRATRSITLAGSTNDRYRRQLASAGAVTIGLQPKVGKVSKPH